MKKLLFVLVLAIAVCSLASCSTSVSDPIELANVLIEEDYHVSITVEKDDIDMLADEMEVKANGITCMLYAQPDDYNDERSGFFIFCESTKIARDMKEDLESYLEKDEFDDGIIRATVEVSGSTVFVGCKDVWEDIQ